MPLSERLEMSLELRYDNVRHYYIRIRQADVRDRGMPADFVNVVRKKDKIECQTLVLAKLNSKVGRKNESTLPHISHPIRSLIRTPSAF